jgi:hypothetical protein
MGKNINKVQPAGAMQRGLGGLPNVNESFKTNNPQQSVLPSLSRTGNYFNPNPYNPSRRAEPIGSVANGQRVASRRTSTR